MKKKAAKSSEDEDEKLWQSSGRWLQRLCKSGKAALVSDPERIANLLQEGNEKLGLGINIDMDHIKERLRITDAEMMMMGIHHNAAGQGQKQLFIRRELNMTDMSKHQHKLSMPCNQVNEAVLTAEETETMRQGGKIPAELVGPNGRKYEVRLKWMKAGKTSNSYAIGKPWNDIKWDNGFQAGMVLNVWTFRPHGGRLCFLLQIYEHDYH